MFKWKVKEFEISSECGINIFDSDEVSDWLNKKGIMPEDMNPVWDGHILKIYYREWSTDNV